MYQLCPVFLTVLAHALHFLSLIFHHNTQLYVGRLVNYWQSLNQLSGAQCVNVSEEIRDALMDAVFRPAARKEWKADWQS